MSDFGTEDHYVAAVKAVVLSLAPGCTIVDISHQVLLGDVGQAGYLLRSVFRDFPEGSIHICSVDRSGKAPSKMIALSLEGHFFLGPDVGTFSLISDQRPGQIIEISSQHASSTFPSKTILAPAAARLTQGVHLSELGTERPEMMTLFARKLKVTKREIAGNVMRVDHYGNLITNITKNEFETITQINNHAPFAIIIGRETVTEIHQSYADVDSGDCFVFFNSLDQLQIGINKGNASELLGIKLDTPITVAFRI